MAKEKKQLFEGEQDSKQVEFGSKVGNMSINQDFASKFEKRETKKLIQKGREMEKDDEDSSEYSDEDSEGVLINDTIEQKFMETIARIRANDPKLKATKDDIFKEKDFDLDNIKEKPKEEKPVTFKSMMADKVKKKFGKNLEKNINEVSDQDSEAEDEGKKETDVQMQKRLKEDFIKAAVEEEDGGSDSDILMVKPKSKEQLEQEQQDMKILEEKAKEKKVQENNFLRDFWSKKSKKKLSEEDKFLRSYIMGEKWKEIEEEYDSKADEEDFERDSEVDEFEENYNFRFEERDGDKIRTYPRTIEDTYRIARNKRMSNKIAKKKRMKEYLKERKMEREKIANIKRSEIIKRLQQTEEIAGSQAVGKRIMKELETDFDPQTYDKIMTKAFNEEYYNEDDEKQKVFEETIVDRIPVVSKFGTQAEEEKESDAEIKEDDKEKESVMGEDQMKHLKKKREVKKVFKQLEEEDNFDIWYACDG